MKKAMIVFGVLACVTLLVNPAMACDGKEAKQASNDGASCSKTAAQQASNDGASCSKAGVEAGQAPGTCARLPRRTLEKTGCEKTAQTAYNNTMAENVYAKTVAESGCTKTAQKAAYDAVYTSTSCDKVFDLRRDPCGCQGVLQRDPGQDRLREDRRGGLRQRDQDRRRQLRHRQRQGRLRQRRGELHRGRRHHRRQNGFEREQLKQHSERVYRHPGRMARVFFCDREHSGPPANECDLAI